jgi:hypothetical protein
VVGLEGRYEVSNYGQVRRLWYRNGTCSRKLDPPELMKPGYRTSCRYPYVALASIEGPTKFNIHALVAAAFLGPPPSPDHLVAHLDGNGSNPVLANLGYVTRSENEQHKKVHGTNTRFKGSDSTAAKLLPEQVREMRALRERFGETLPYKVLGRMFGVCMSAALKVCLGQTYRDVA